MRSAAYGVVFAVLAAVAALAAVPAPGAFRVAGAASALSFLVVAAAYFGAGPRLLFKRANGRRPAWAWLVHWPYFALVAFSYRLAVLLAREPTYVRVAPNVFLGRRLTGREAKAARAEGWLAVLDLAAELTDPYPLRELPHYLSLPVLDATALRPEQLGEAVVWVRKRVASGPVYVHCALGHGRSALVVAAYLLAVGVATDPKAALGHLRGVRLNQAQRAALDAFAKELNGRPDAG